MQLTPCIVMVLTNHYIKSIVQKMQNSIANIDILYLQHVKIIRFIILMSMSYIWTHGFVSIF